MAKKAATPATITLKHLAADVAEEHEMSKKQAEAILTDLVTRIAKHLKKGERIRIVGLGILQVRKRAARMGRNPATGEQIQIKASKKVAFRAAKELKKLSDKKIAQATDFSAKWPHSAELNATIGGGATLRYPKAAFSVTRLSP
jgi:DNA-binding protein HU-beta